MPAFVPSVLYRFRAFKGKIRLMYLAIRHPKTPPASRFFALLTILYLLSPVDIVPDVIPFAGWIDDLIIAPLIFSVALRIIPENVVEEISKKDKGKKSSWLQWLAILLLVVGILWLLALLIGKL